MIHTLSISFIDREEALALRSLIEELGYTVELHRTDGARNDPKLKPSETRSGKLVATYFQCNPSRSFTSDDIGILLEENNYKASSASPLLWSLVQEGILRKIGSGCYRLNGENT